MRTKRKTYDYHSSDYGNEDYGQDDFDGEEDDFDEEDQVEESDGDSDYGDSADDKGKKHPGGTKARTSNKNRDRDQDEEIEDTYEDEDPFSPEIDLILSDKQVEVTQPQIPSQQNQSSARPIQRAYLQSLSKTQNYFLVKFADQSYLHVKWMEESELEEYSYRAKQKIRRYWNQKEKKRIIAEQNSRQAIGFKQTKNHHFSEDEEEEEDEEDAAIKGIPLPDLPMVSDDIVEVEQIKAKHIKVESPDGEDLTKYFDQNYTVVERILSTTLIFPVIHPRQAKQIRGKWQEDCLKVMNVLINFRKNNVCLGLAFAEQLDAEKLYQQPIDFWNDLGLVFKNCRLYYKSPKIGLRKQCDALRCLAYNLYEDWYKEQKTRFTTGVALPIPPPPQYNSSSQLDSSKPSMPLQPEKDTTIVNLSSLLRNQKNVQEQQNQVLQQQQLQQQQLLVPQQQPIQQIQQTQRQNVNSQPLMIENGVQQQSSDMWNVQRTQTPVMNPNPQMQVQQQPFQQLPPNLPKFNQILNPMNTSQPQPNFQDSLAVQQQQLQQQQQQQQQNQQVPQQMGATNQAFINQQNQFRPPSQPNQNVMFGQQQQPQPPPFMNQFEIPQNPQVDQWMQGSIEKNIMKSFLGGPQGVYPQDQSQGGLHLPSIGSLQQNLLQNNYMIPSYGQFGGPQNPMMEMNTFQAIQQDNNKNLNLLNQMIGMPNAQGQMPMDQMNQMGMITQGGQDYGQFGMRQGHTQLPSLNQFQGFNQQQLGSFQLPSLASMQTIGSQLNTYDPYSQMQQNFMNPMQQQQNMLNRMGYPNGSTGFNTANAYDEMSMMLGNVYNPINTLPGGFNPFGQMDMPNNPQMLGYGNQPQIHQNVYGQMPMNQSPMGGFRQPQQQKTSIIDPNLILPDNEVPNDKQDPPVPPCIIDPGQYDITWLLEQGEKPEDLARCLYLTQDQIDVAVRNKHYVDQLYLIKWKSLSYTQSSWEPESMIREFFEEKSLDYNKFNRSLDQFQRDRLEQLIKNHKKMLRLTEKKYQQGKRIDAQQENYLSLQEAKINRALLNQKIQEIMGDAFYQIVQYSDQKGIVPQFKKTSQQLKDYQVSGLNWLIRAWHEHRNVVLADEMGLGKTIMTLSLFDHLNKVYKLRGPYLILAPLTTLEHWKRIADEWTNLNSVLYYDPGSSEGRNEIRQWEWFYTDVTYKGTITQKSELYKFNILITSFEVFMQDLNPIIQEIPFIYIVVDEAHRLKNKQAKTLKLLKDHPCKRILLLTGTPVQNNTKELWTLLNYIEPEKFNSVDLFLEQYGNLETYDQIQKLHTILKPHFLRRLKEEVDNSIPPLNETVIEVGLTTLQNTYYKGIYGENRMVLAKFGTNSIKTSQLNNIDVQLRKCCNHLFLLKGVEEELTRDCKDENDLYKKLLDSSGKLMLLDKFIEKFKEENHKMLIFSQFKRMLDVIELYLKMKAVPYEKLTGSVKTQDRISSIQRFNDDKTFGVFLLTTRAGGLGINLTSARVVIIFDSDWNPQNDLQAIARAHRIGQKFEVQVYRLITSKTYEEQMFERASKKLGMEQALFSKGAFNQNDEDIGTLHLRGFTELKQDSKEIENLLKYGAYAFIDNDGEDDQANNKDIDEILATSKKKEFTYSKGIYTLQKSSFNATKYEKLPDVNDPDFWNKVMPYESIISISVLERKFKKEKKEMSRSEKIQKEFIKDLEIVFNDFMDAKFDVRTTNASRKQLESDEEKLREVLKKMIKLNGMKPLYIEKCKEWLRGMLKTNKRKKQPTMRHMHSGQVDELGAPIDEDFDEQAVVEDDDDIIIYDSDDQLNNPRSLRRRKDVPYQQKETSQNPKTGNKRGRKPKVVAGKEPQFDESENFEDEDEMYGEEEDKDYDQNQQYQQNSSEIANEDDYNGNGYDDSSDEEQSGRYGLRGRRKRQKTGREEMLMQQQQRSGQSLPKINDQFAKRNEKNGIVCAYCMHPETPTNLCAWFCFGYCQRFFHEECKDTLFACEGKRLPNSSLNKGIWQCDDCLDNKALCFCCKQKGQILLFPKKGKPKAAGHNSDTNIALGNGMDLIEEDEENEDEMLFDEDGNGDLDNDDELAIQEEEEVEEAVQNNIQQQEDNEEDKAIDEVKEKEVEEIEILDAEIDGEGIEEKEGEGEDEDVEDEIEEDIEKLSSKDIEGEDDDEKDQSSKKLENDAKEEEETKNDGDIPLPNLTQNVSTKIVISASVQKPPLSEQQSDQKLSVSSPAESEPDDNKYVVRCTLGGCFKYYHVNCVYKNKNVSCINSRKVQRFRCPLHYCEICQASGDSVLIVQCVYCPTAYHLKCLPQDLKAIRLTKKYIICGKHNMCQEDFPKYEEKANANLYGQDNPSFNKGNRQRGNMQLQKVEKRKKRNKKRGRKPRNQVNEDYDDEVSEQEQPVYLQPKPAKSHSVQIVKVDSSSKLGSQNFIPKEQQNQGQNNSSSFLNQKSEQIQPKILFAVEKHQSRTKLQKDY